MLQIQFNEKGFPDEQCVRGKTGCKVTPLIFAEDETGSFMHYCPLHFIVLFAAESLVEGPKYPAEAVATLLSCCQQELIRLAREGVYDDVVDEQTETTH